MKFRKFKSIITLTVLAGSLLWASCGSVRQGHLPELRTMPRGADSPDAAAVKPIEWEVLFAEQNLKKLIDTALAGNFDLRSGLQRVITAGANLKMARAEMLPTLRAGVHAGIDKYGDYTMNGVGNYDTNFSPNIDANRRIPDPTADYFAGFRSSWEIDIWGKLSKRKAAAYNRYLATGKGLQWYRTQLISQVAELYFELVALDRKLEILGRNIKLQQAGLEVVEAQMAGGRATALAVSQFRAQQTATIGKQFEIRQAITKVENELNLLLGRYPGRIERDTAETAMQLPDTVYTGIPSKVILGRPDVREAEYRLAAAKADVSAARKAFLPSLTLDAYAGYNSFKLPLLFNPGSVAAGLLGGLTAPVLNRATLKGMNVAANAAQFSAFLDYQKSIINGYQEVATQLSAIGNYKSAYQYKEKEVAELRSAVSTANDLYLSGYANYLEVIVAQASVLAAEMEQVELQRAANHALIGLFRALGG